MTNYIISKQPQPTKKTTLKPNHGEFLMPTKTLPTLTLNLTPPDFQFDKRNDGWKLMEDMNLNPNETGFELAEFLEGEDSVKGDVMVARAKKLGNLTGQKHAELLLRNQDQIPEEWRDFYLVFPGTVWRNRSGRLVAPYLDWGGVRWDLYWRWLENDWRSLDRLVRLRGPACR